MCVGGVYADRQLKTTRLPTSLESGRVITFETELIAVNKVRVTVEVCEKVITFDWMIPSSTAAANVGGLPDAAAHVNMGGLAGLGAFGGGLGALGGGAAEKVSLYFFTRLSRPGVSVTVE